MKLSTYCDKRPDRKKKVAEACGVTVTAVTHWCNGNRHPQPKYWLDIERATERNVTAADWLDDAEQKRAA